jgi:hypothetical protein
MTKFCPNCGNPIDEGALFCDSCGTKLDAQQINLHEQAPSQPYGDPYNQFPQQTQQQYTPYRQPVQQQGRPYPQYGQPYPQYGGQQPPQKPQKNKTGLIVALSIAGVVVIAAVVVFVLMILPKLQTGGKTEPTEPTSVTEKVTEQATEAATEAPTEAPTEPSTEAPTEKPTEAPTEPPADLPYANSLGKISATDFAWIADAMSGGLTGDFLSNDALLGKWKGEIIYDGAWELVYVTIDRDAKIIIEPYQINYGDGWEDESGERPYVFNGAFDISSVNGAGNYGSINLYTFLESNGTQYCVGTFSVNNTSSADVYMVRP